MSAADQAAWQRWHENYSATFIERDIARQGTKISPIHMRRLMGMIAHYHGGLLNVSEFGRSLGFSYHTVNTYLDILEAHFLIRRLPPYYSTIKKRIVKAPKIYIRDAGMLHNLLGVSQERGLLESAKRGSSWEGLAIEQLIALEQLHRVGSRFYFYRTYVGAEIDLIIDRGEEQRIGFEFKCALSVTKRDWANLKAGIEDGIIHQGFVVYLGDREFSAEENIDVKSAPLFLHLHGF